MNRANKRARLSSQPIEGDTTSGGSDRERIKELEDEIFRLKNKKFNIYENGKIYW